MRRDTERYAFVALLAHLWVLGILGLTPLVAHAQTARTSTDPFVEVGIETGRTFQLDALLEVTVFRIDVLTLEVRLPFELLPDAVRTAGPESPREAVGDSLARLVLASDRLWARQELQRDVSMDRLTSGILDTVERAVRAGWVSAAYHDSLEQELPMLFSFLEDDGARRGDQIFFEVRGDTVRTVYRAIDGSVRMDRTTGAPEARAASIPAFFAPGTRFREDLLDSLVRITGR